MFVDFPIALSQIWYGVFALLLVGYVILDGFDLGVGMLHLWNREDHCRRVLLNAIGPVWDGNEVWLVTAGGALFAGFPKAYATIASGFYIPIMLFLCGLIFRACAIEFRSKHESHKWRNTWDIAFSAASFLITFLLGVLMGHFVMGVPLDAQGNIIRDQLVLFHPFALLTGFAAVSCCMMHGCIFVLMKTEGTIHDYFRARVNNCIIFFVICYVLLTMATLVYIPHMAQPFKEYPALFVLPLATMLAVANIPRSVFHGRDGWAFISSSVSIALLLSKFAIGCFPYLLRNRFGIDGRSLTIENSASSDLSLSILLLFVLIGVPFVLAYTSVIYWIFRGKVKLDSMSY